MAKNRPTLECRRDIGEIGDTTADDQNLAIGMLGAGGHQVENGLCVFVGLLFARCARILAIVGQFGGAAQLADGVRIDHRRTATGHHRPDATGFVQDGQLKTGARFGVQIVNVLLFRMQIATERRRRVHFAPGGLANELGGHVQLGGQIEYVDRVLGDHQRIDLQVGEVQLDVGLVEGCNEFGQTFALIGSGHFGQQTLLDLGLAWHLIDGDVQFERFCVHIADVYAALVMKQNRIAIAMRVDAHIDLFAGLMRNERLDYELLQFAGGTIDLDVLVDAFVDPLLALSDVLIYSDQTELASSLDQLIWFGD